MTYHHVIKSVGAFSAAIVFLTSAPFAFAQDPSPLNERLKALREQAEIRAEKVRESIEEKREEAKTKFQESRETAVQKIRKIKDEKKQEAANKIIKQLDHVNRQWTDHFLNVLDRLDALTQKVQSRAEKAAANGKNTTSTTSAIKNAESKIEAARKAVETQAQKSYTLNPSSLPTGGDSTGEQQRLVNGLRAQFQALRDQLHTDLSSLRDGPMKDARDAVQSAIKSISSVKGVDND